jgi:hypothetical protein
MELKTDADGAAVAFGFLTVVDSSAHGLFGGYLLVDGAGRPLEFHCTAPVKVSRAQAILYGPTLHGHLHGRQIGGTLLGEGSMAPVVVLTDQEPLLQVRPHTSLPVALVRRSDAPADSAGFSVGSVHVSPPGGDPGRQATIRERLEELGTAVDLCEPFERIRAAIDEAQRH